MNILDIILIVLLVMAAVSGYREGLLMEAVSIAAFFIGIIAAFKLMDVGVGFLADTFNLSGAWLPIAALILIFAGVVLLTRWVGKIIRKVVHATPFGLLDNLGGALLSIFKFALGVSAMIWALDFFHVSLPGKWTDGSLVFPYLDDMSAMLWDWVSVMLPYANEQIDSLREEVDI